jgi:DNA-directed RNA polymerase specialized sigma24 family protein
VVDFRFFLGCSIEETADLLGASVRSVRDDWDFARVWLQKQFGAAGN